MVCSNCNAQLNMVKVLQKRVCYVSVEDNALTVRISGDWIDKEIVRAVLEWDGLNAFRVPELFKHMRVTENGALVANDIDISCPVCGASLIRKGDRENAVVRNK